MVVCPGYTHTEFHDRAGLGRSGAAGVRCGRRPTQVVAGALRDLDRGRSLSIPGALNKASAAFTSVAPAGVSRESPADRPPIRLTPQPHEPASANRRLGRAADAALAS